MPDTHLILAVTLDEASEPLGVLAGRYLDRQREFDQDDEPHTDETVEQFGDEQEDLLRIIEDTPAVTVDDIITKLEVIRAEIWDRVGGDEEQLEPADRLVFTLADDFRRVLGTTTTYRFEPRLWVESAIRAGMNPLAHIHLVPSDDGRRHYETSRRLFETVEGVDARYAPPPPADDAEMRAVIDELARRGRADYFTGPARTGEAIAVE